MMAALSLGGCGGGSGSGNSAGLLAASQATAAGQTPPATGPAADPEAASPPPAEPVARFSVGGAVQGLVGEGLVLQNNAGDDLPIAADGAFAFASSLPSGSTYAVTVKNQPTLLTRTCRVVAGGGQLIAVAVVDVLVTCGPRKPRFAYVANTAVGTVSQFTVDPVTSALAPMAGPAVAAGSAPFAIAVHPQGRFAYVTDFGARAVLAYDIDAVSGQLRPMRVPSIAATGNGPTAMTIDPTGRYLFVTNPLSNTLSGYLIDPSTGALSPMPTPTVAVGVFPTGVSVDGLGRFLYVTNGNSSNLSQMRISPTAVATPLVPGTVATGLAPNAVVADPAGRFVFVVDSTGPAGNVRVFRADFDTGSLNLASTASVSRRADSVAIDPSGRILYAANFLDGNLSSFVLDRTTGVLAPTAVPLTTTGLGPECVVFSPDGLSAYVCNSIGAAGSISQFDVVAATGALRPKTPPVVPTDGDGPQSLAFAP